MGRSFAFRRRLAVLGRSESRCVLLHFCLKVRLTLTLLSGYSPSSPFHYSPVRESHSWIEHSSDFPSRSQVSPAYNARSPGGAGAYSPWVDRSRPAGAATPSYSPTSPMINFSVSGLVGSPSCACSDLSSSQPASPRFSPVRNPISAQLAATDRYLSLTPGLPELLAVSHCLS